MPRPRRPKRDRGRLGAALRGEGSGEGPARRAFSSPGRALAGVETRAVPSGCAALRPCAFCHDPGIYASFVAWDQPASLRQARLAAGLSQAALAAAAGISRQAVGAIEARPAPAERRRGDGARERGRPVGRGALRPAAAAPSRPLDRVGGRRAAACWPLASAPGSSTPRRARARASRAGRAPTRSCATAGPSRCRAATSTASCWSAATRRSGSRPPCCRAAGPRRVIALSGSTRDRARRDARRAARTPRSSTARPDGCRRPAGALRLHLARWRVGVASRGRRPRPISELAGRGPRRAARGRRVEPAGVRRRDRRRGRAAAARPGRRRAPRRRAPRRHGAPAGVTMEPAAIGTAAGLRAARGARRRGLDRRRAAREHPAVDAIGDLLRSRAFTARLALVGGYDLDRCGAERA